MVKVGFICEGETERIIIESSSFKEFLNLIGVEFIEALNATGSGNLHSKNISRYTQTLLGNGAQKIIILTDLDEDKCVTVTKQRIDPSNEYITIVSIKTIEAWFLADSPTLSSLLKGKFICEFPEKELRPREVLKRTFLQKTGKGIGSSKPEFAQKMINNGFTITNAAAHNNCKSAAYFVQKLKSLAK